MLKGHYQVAKKLVDEEVDSADELEPGIDESGFVSQKLPQSNIRINPNRFASKGSISDSQAPKDRTNSPLKEKNLNNNQAKFKVQAPNEESEAIKKLLYMSPKEAAQEYLASSNKSQQGTVPQMSVKASKAQPSASNKENARRDEENYPPETSAYTELAAKIYNQKFYNNTPQTRQIQVGSTPTANLLLSANEAQRIEDKRYLASKEAQEDVVERLIKQGEAMSEHKGALTSAYLSKEQQECPFVPRILSDKPRRNFNQFLEDQKQFQAQVEMKKKKKQEQAMLEKNKEDHSYKPAICQNSVKMLEKRKQQGKEKGPAFERLYSLGKNAQTKQMQDDLFGNGETGESGNFIGMLGTRDSTGSLSQGRTVKGKEPKFTPNIQKKSKNLKREDRVDNLLYNDALRRQHKTLEAEKMSKSRSMTMSTMSSTSKRALAMRFIKEFDIAILEYLEVGKEPKLDYIKLNDFLRKLCFLKESEQVENPHFTPERLLLYDMWYMLHGDKYKGIHRRNLLVFLLALLNLHFPITKIEHRNPEEEAQRHNEEGGHKQTQFLDQNNNPVLPEDEEGQPIVRERREVGSFDGDGNYELTEEEVRRLHKIFELWHFNRMSSADNLGQMISTRSQQEFSYRPEINEASRNLAQNYREKMLEGTAELIQQNKIAAPKDGKITHADLLIVSKKVTQEKVNKYGELLKEEQSKEFTYKPQTKQYDQSVNSSMVRAGIEDTDRGARGSQQSRRQNVMTSESLGKDRVFELYSLAKPRVLKKDKDAVEVDLEKNAEECTFHPNTGLTRDSRVYATEPTEFFAKGIEKTIDRMRTARAEKEMLNQMNERGFTTGNEGHFVFGIDKNKFAKESEPVSKIPSIYKGSRRESQQTSHYREEHPYGEGQEMRDEEGEGEGGNQEYEYGQEGHEQYEDHTYGIEPEEGLREVQEDENEGEEQGYQNQGENVEQPKFQRDVEENEENERVPLLFVDVNLGQGRTERIVVFEGDRSDELAAKFAEEHGLEPSMKGKLKELLDSQIASLLSRIDEEMSETERQQHSEQYVHDQIQEEEDYVEEGSEGER